MTLWRIEPEGGIIRNMLQSIKNFFHYLTAISANLVFRCPSKNLTVIGVTGTDGKTTTVNLICHILNASGRRVGMISSIGAFIKNKKYDVGFHVTTPSSFGLQKLLRKIVDSKAQYAVVEVTSHALDQNRVFGIKFDIAVLTNVTHEHLDYHKTYENYVKTKFKLLKSSRAAVVNMDDKSSYRLISNFKSKIPNKKIITYGRTRDADINLNNFSFKSKLMGAFNEYNILAAVAVCRQLGVSDADIRRSIASFDPPLGRGNIVYNKDFSVMIDFAHTPNAFKQLLISLRPLVSKRIIHVFGCAGERDFSKRPEMGKISSSYADVIVLTAEDPRSESAEKIIAEIESGIKNYELWKRRGCLLQISDRQDAISTAIGMAQREDLVLLTGKGHEKSMNYGKGEEPWDEYEAVRKGINLRNEKR